MKIYLKICLIGFVVFTLITRCKNEKSSNAITLKNSNDTVSYIIGTSIGSNFRLRGIEVNNDILIKGIEEGVKGDKRMFSEEIANKVMTKYQRDLSAKLADKNKKAGQQFLTDNKKKDGVITLPDGLQYKIIREGKGPKPKETDRVTVNYEGTLIDGKVFDSSYERKQPVTFPLNQVIRGWSEALQMMPVGSAWQVFIPSDLGYGDMGQQNIPPGSTLIFKVELLSIEKGEAPNISQKPKN